MSSEVANYFNKTRQVVRLYLSELNRYTPETFAVSPAPESWSACQMYVHLLLSTNMLMIPMIEKCLKKDKTFSAKQPLMTRVIFWLDQLPPTRIKMPAQAAAVPMPNLPIQEVRAALEALLVSLDELEKKFAGSFDPEARKKHPLLGPLNALEWLRNIDLHFRHHLRQKARIDRYLEGIQPSGL